MIFLGTTSNNKKFDNPGEIAALKEKLCIEQEDNEALAFFDEITGSSGEVNLFFNDKEEMMEALRNCFAMFLDKTALKKGIMQYEDFKKSTEALEYKKAITSGKMTKADVWMKKSLVEIARDYEKHADSYGEFYQELMIKKGFAQEVNELIKLEEISVRKRLAMAGLIAQLHFAFEKDMLTDIGITLKESQKEHHKIKEAIKINGETGEKERRELGFISEKTKEKSETLYKSLRNNPYVKFYEGIQENSLDNMLFMSTRLKVSPQNENNTIYILQKNKQGDGYVAVNNAGEESQFNSTAKRPFVILADEPTKILIEGQATAPMGGHTRISNGKDVLFAGEVWMEGSKLKWSNDSGHYRTFIGSLHQTQYKTFLNSLRQTQQEAEDVLLPETFQARTKH